MRAYLKAQNRMRYGIEIFSTLPDIGCIFFLTDNAWNGTPEFSLQTIPLYSSLLRYSGTMMMPNVEQ
jgi:hypothetical protein